MSNGLIGYNTRGFRETMMGIGSLGMETTNHHRKFRWYLDAWDKHGHELCRSLHIIFEQRPDKTKAMFLVQAHFLDEQEALDCRDAWTYLCDGYATAGLYDATGNVLETWDFDILTTIKSRIMVDDGLYVVEAAMRYVDVYPTINT